MTPLTGRLACERVRATGFTAITPSGFGPRIASGLLLQRGRVMSKLNALCHSRFCRPLGLALAGAVALASAASADPV